MPGFYTLTPNNNVIHINGDPNMDSDTLRRLERIFDMAYNSIGVHCAECGEWVLKEEANFLGENEREIWVCDAHAEDTQNV